MSSLKQLKTKVSGYGTTVQNYSPSAGGFVETVASRGNSRATPSAPGGRPGLTICSDFGFGTVRAVMRRSISSQSRVLLRVARLPSNLGMVHRFILAGVDAVLVESDAVARVLRASGVPAPRLVRVSDPGDLALFSHTPHSRVATSARRMLHVGDLEPEAGVAELLSCVVAWADRNPDRDAEIWWAGEGCLRGVLEAQPVPPNVVQQFPGKVSREQLAVMFRDCDMLAIPALSDPWSDVVEEAMVAGLPVLGSSRSRAVVERVTSGKTGWIFDPFEAEAMAVAVELALNTTSQELDQMRLYADVGLRPSPPPGLDERIRQALRLGTSEPPFDISSLGFSS